MQLMERKKTTEQQKKEDDENRKNGTKNKFRGKTVKNLSPTEQAELLEYIAKDLGYL